MDVAKYIGLFLLKNNLVYINGIGNLELIKHPASYLDGQLIPSYFEVIIGISGSIDDNLSNFIANNEQISISKASNALREFSTQVKLDLEQGREVIIPAIGKLIEVSGKVQFITDSKLQFRASNIAAEKRNPQPIDPFMNAQPTGFLQQQFYNPPMPNPQENQAFQTNNFHQQPVSEVYYEEEAASSSKINWTRVLIALGIFIFIIVVIFVAINFLGSDSNKGKKIIMPQNSEVPTSSTSNSLAKPDSSLVESLATGGITFDVRLFAFSDFNKAKLRMKYLQNKGYSDVYLYQTPDSSLTFVLIPIEHVSPADTAVLMDSLRQLNVMNPYKVGVYRFR